ncbi:hypothetical protein EJ08DRAFT_725911 [Tothia fuscella]|uniref:Uncharacterized protein n=1 Tax=Tothia fuscella TaxID=1048955 RepID=A0A9P4NHZ9_9PEZI|nr:hypothetical protein EJ08DRAFT_725911 [Tothia fuscella]
MEPTAKRQRREISLDPIAQSFAQSFQNVINDKKKLKMQMGELKHKTEILEEAVQNPNLTISSREQELEGANKNIRELEDKVQILEEALQNANLTISSREQELEGVNKNIRELENKVQTLEEGLRNANVTTSDQEQELEGVNKNLRELENKVQILEEALQNANLTISSREQELEGVNKNIRELEHSNTCLDEAKKVILEENLKLKENMEKLTKKMAATESKSNRVKDLEANLKIAVEETEIEKQEVGKLKCELGNSQQRLGQQLQRLTNSSNLLKCIITEKDLAIEGLTEGKEIVTEEKENQKQSLKLAAAQSSAHIETLTAVTDLKLKAANDTITTLNNDLDRSSGERDMYYNSLLDASIILTKMSSMSILDVGRFVEKVESIHEKIRREGLLVEDFWVEMRSLTKKLEKKREKEKEKEAKKG